MLRLWHDDRARSRCGARDPLLSALSARDYEVNGRTGCGGALTAVPLLPHPIRSSQPASLDR